MRELLTSSASILIHADYNIKYNQSLLHCYLQIMKLESFISIVLQGFINVLIDLIEYDFLLHMSVSEA